MVDDEFMKACPQSKSGSGPSVPCLTLYEAFGPKIEYVCPSEVTDNVFLVASKSVFNAPPLA